MQAPLRLFAGESDLLKLVELFNHSAAIDPTENATSVEELRADVHRPSIDVRKHVVVVERDSRLAGFAAILTMLNKDKSEMHLWLRSTPEAAAEVDPILADWFIQQGTTHANESGRPVELLVISADRAMVRNKLFAERGFQPLRYFFRMARTLGETITPVPLPRGYSLRTLHGMEEMPNWVEAYNNSFVDHWHFSPMILEQAMHFAQQDPNYSRDGDLVAIASDGKIGAFCQCVIRANENAVTGRKEGWIALLGTCRGHRGIGLGRAMLTAGLEWIAAQGMNTALLGVDASNPTGALGLYESVGFGINLRRTMYAKNIPPAAKTNLS